MDKKVNPKIVVKEYLKNIPRSIKVKGIFLFGSYATGRVGNDSDIDIIVISPNFKNISFIKRLEMLSHVQGAGKITRSVPMDIFGYTPKEFKDIDKESIVMRRAKKEGKMIYDSKANK